MSIATEPEAPVAVPPPPTSPPSDTSTVVRPAAALPPTPPPTWAMAPRPTAAPRPRGVLVGLILIAVGVVALFGIWFPGGGAWLFLGLGIAFAIARVLTSRYGYAVPAGILLGFGSFIWFTESGILAGPAAGGTFFIFLGL